MNLLKLLLIIPLAFFLACQSTSEDSTSQTSGSVSLTASKMGMSGTFVDLNGNGVEDVLLGAPDAPVSTRQGCALAYCYSSGSFSSAPVWEAMGEAGGDGMGSLVKNLGDVNGDGKSDLGVSALFGTGRAPLSGCVYVYGCGGSQPELLVKLTGHTAFDKFGYDIAGGDLNADGVKDIIVSALFAAGEAYQSGVTYVYFGGAELSSSPDATIQGTGVNHGSGYALETGDINGDGISDLFIGNSGSVSIYYGRADFASHVAGGPAPDVIVHGSSPGAGGHSGSGFGEAILYLGDVDGDGIGDVAISNPKRIQAEVYDNRGSVHIFKGGQSLPAEIYETDTNYKLAKISGDEGPGRFGTTLALAGDVNNQGKPDILVTAIWANGDETRSRTVSGKVFLFYTEDLLAAPAGEHTTSIAAVVFSADTPSGEFGRFLSVGSDGKLLVGAPSADNGNGMAFLYDLSGAMLAVLNSN